MFFKVNESEKTHLPFDFPKAALRDANESKGTRRHEKRKENENERKERKKTVISEIIH